MGLDSLVLTISEIDGCSNEVERSGPEFGTLITSSGSVPHRWHATVCFDEWLARALDQP